MTRFAKITFRPCLGLGEFHDQIEGLTSSLFPGLVVHRSLEEHGGWTVSHIASGVALNRTYQDLAAILGAAVALAAICNWSQWHTHEEAQFGAKPYKERLLAVFELPIDTRDGDELDADETAEEAVA